MKKLFVMLFAISIATTATIAAEEIKTNDNGILQQKITEKRIQRDKAFERRLELTEVQKLKARQIRQKGHEQLFPVIEQIKSKKQEAEMIRRSRMAVQMQEEKLTVIDAELKVLEKKANEIRKSNMKEFESILTKKQKRTLREMKKEGRQRYHSQHPNNIQKMLPHKCVDPNCTEHTK